MYIIFLSEHFSNNEICLLLKTLESEQILLQAAQPLSNAIFNSLIKERA